MAMNRAQFKKQLQMGLNSVFGLEYTRYKEVWREYLDVETENSKAYIEEVMMSGFSTAPVKAEGSAVSYDSASEVYTARYVFETIALAFSITEEAEEDNLYGSIGQKLSRALARSMQHTKAIKCANLLNNGFDTNFPMGDTKPVFSTSHLTQGGQGSNMLATAADLSETSLEDMLILIGGATDYKGIPLVLEATKMVVPNELQFVAQRILKNPNRPDTANRDISATYSMGLLSGGWVKDVRLTDTDAWFIKTDCPDGAKHVVRKAISKGVEGDFETGNMRYKARERFAIGISDWHGMFGTAGG